MHYQNFVPERRTGNGSRNVFQRSLGLIDTSMTTSKPRDQRTESRRLVPLPNLPRPPVATELSRRSRKLRENTHARVLFHGALRPLLVAFCNLLVGSGINTGSAVDFVALGPWSMGRLSVALEVICRSL